MHVLQIQLDMSSSNRRHETRLAVVPKPLGIICAWGICNFYLRRLFNEGQRSTCSWPQHPCENGDGRGLSCPILACMSAIASLINQLISFHSRWRCMWDHMIAVACMAKLTSPCHWAHDPTLPEGPCTRMYATLCQPLLGISLQSCLLLICK